MQPWVGRWLLLLLDNRLLHDKAHGMISVIERPVGDDMSLILSGVGPTSQASPLRAAIRQSDVKQAQVKKSRSPYPVTESE